MNIKEALYEWLHSDSEIASIVGTTIRPVQSPPSDDLPAIVYDRIGGARFQDLSGNSNGGQTSFALYCFAATDAVATRLAEAVRRRLTLEEWTGPSDLSFEVLCVLEDDLADGQEAPLHAEDLAPYRVDLIVTVTHQQ